MCNFLMCNCADDNSRCHVDCCEKIDDNLAYLMVPYFVFNPNDGMGGEDTPENYDNVMCICSDCIKASPEAFDCPCFRMPQNLNFHQVKKKTKLLSQLPRNQRLIINKIIK